MILPDNSLSLSLKRRDVSKTWRIGIEKRWLRLEKSSEQPLQVMVVLVAVADTKMKMKTLLTMVLPKAEMALLEAMATKKAMAEEPLLAAAKTMVALVLVRVGLATELTAAEVITKVSVEVPPLRITRTNREMKTMLAEEAKLVTKKMKTNNKKKSLLAEVVKLEMAATGLIMEIMLVGIIMNKKII
jgi:Trp operon repressor